MRDDRLNAKAERHAAHVVRADVVDVACRGEDAKVRRVADIRRAQPPVLRGAAAVR